MSSINISKKWSSIIDYKVNPNNNDELIFNQQNAIIPPFDMAAFRANPYFVTNRPALDLRTEVIDDDTLLNQYLESVILAGQNVLNINRNLYTNYTEALNRWTAQLIIAHMIALYQWNLVGGNTLDIYKQNEGMRMSDVMEESKHWTKTRFGLQLQTQQLNQPQLNGYTSDNMYMEIGG